MIPHFGTKIPSEITSSDVRIFQESLYERVKPKTIQNIRSLLSCILERGIILEIVDENPVKKTKWKKAKVPSMKFWNEEEVGKVLSYTHKNHPRYFPVYAVMLYTGIRMGEVTALMWKDIDFENLTITIQRNIVDGIEGTPKGGNHRIINVDNDLMAILREHKKTSPSVNGRVFSGKKIKFFTRDSLKYFHSTLQKRVAVEKIRIHDMRHTYATMAIRRGVSITTLQE